MIEVRPTLEVLKVLEKGGMLPLETVRGLDHARKVDDEETRLGLLVDLDLSSLDIPLLRDARAGFANGNPDRQSEMTAKAPCTVYEVRDRSTGWRGAVVKPDGDCAWLVLADVHDRFHAVGPNVIRGKAVGGALGPSPLDLRLWETECASRDLRTARATLLELLIDALIDSARTTVPTPVHTTGLFAPAQLSVRVSEQVDPDWVPSEAHGEVSQVAVILSLSSATNAVRDEVIRTCVPFLQPDRSMWEYHFRTELTVQVILSRAGLMQLLSADRPFLPVENREAPAPDSLHYTAKQSLTEAFVSGRAVRAVCGQWWVPVGDDTTHSELPICPDCENEEPFAQTARDLLWQKTRKSAP